jgi:phytoene synthase
VTAATEVSLVRDLTRKSGSNFYYAFLLLPREKREAIYAVYAMARAIDDAVDEASGPDEGRRNLAVWEAEVERLERGEPRDPVACALARARERFPIPLEAIRALLDGARMDLDLARYETFEALRGYCEKVASAIGHMCIEIFGYRSSGARGYATDLGLALQLTNILRDVGQDARRGRLYLPLEDLERFGVPETDLLAGRRTPRVLALLAFEADRAKSFYRSARAQLAPCDRRSLVAAEVMREIYAALLGRIEATSFDVFGRRLALSRARRAFIAGSVWVRTALAGGAVGT